MKLFSMDGKFLETFNKITDLVTLNILWLLCCIPIITIGASTSALYQVTLQIAENRDSYITKEFFKAFRENFRQATIVWLAVIVGTDIYDFNSLICRLHVLFSGNCVFQKQYQKDFQQFIQAGILES